MYGGWDGHLASNNLHMLDVTTLTWTELKPAENSEVPMKMSGCGLVSYGKNKLVLFGGCGVPTEDSQKSSKSAGSGTVSYTTVKTPEGSRGGASQEEEVKLLEVAGLSQEEKKQPHGGRVEFETQAEVHSQPESHDTVPGMSEGVLGLYDLAVSQLDSQTANASESQPASQGEEPTPAPEGEEPHTTESKEASPGKSLTNGLSQEAEAKPESEHEEKGGTEATPSHSQENGEMPTTTPASEENGEVKGDQESQEDPGVTHIGTVDEEKSKSPSHSKENGGEEKGGSQEVGAAGATTSTPTRQNGEVKVQSTPPAAAGSKTPTKKVEIQAEPQTQEVGGDGAESEEESDTESDVMDRRWTNELKVFNISES